MADIQKRLNKSAIIKGATWGTAAQAGAAGCGIIPINPGVIKRVLAPIEVDDVVHAFETGIDFANMGACDFSLDFNYQWTGLENILLAMLMGTAGAPTQQAATAAYLHVLTMKNSVAGIFGTYATEKNDKIHVVPSFKVMKAVFTMSGGLIKVTFSLRGDQVTDADAVVTSMASVTFPTIHTRAKMYQAAFRMNAQAGDALAVGDLIKPKGFTLEIERKFDSEHVAGSRTIVEPLENAKPSVKLTMEFPRMDAVNELYFANWAAETEKKADVTITGPLIASTYYHYLKFEMPRLRIEDVEFADSPVIPAKVTLRSVVADAAPTGMTGLVNPMTINIMNQRTSDLLA
jgi:hypothetical protein